MRWQDILALGEQIVGLQQRFDEQGIVHEDFLPDSALAEHIGEHSAGLPAPAPAGLPAHGLADGMPYNHMLMGAPPPLSHGAPPGMVFHPPYGWIPGPQPGFASAPLHGYAMPPHQGWAAPPM